MGIKKNDWYNFGLLLNNIAYCFIIEFFFNLTRPCVENCFGTGPKNLSFDQKTLICERKRALYGIKCIKGCTYWWIKKNLTHCKHVLCNTLTHSTNEDLLNIKRKGDPKSCTLSRTSDTTETWNLCVIKVILLACFTYTDIFWFNMKSARPWMLAHLKIIWQFHQKVSRFFGPRYIRDDFF